jgi:hypothetical protein
LEFFEKKLGREIERVVIEVDRQLIILPYIPEETHMKKSKGEE